MDLLPSHISQYAEKHTSPESDILKSLNEETHRNIFLPLMLSGHLQGKFLSFISKLLHPKRILEIGTYTGYSAIALAEGLDKDGKLVTIDYNAELKDIVLKYIEKANLSDSVDFLVGEALKIIPTLDEKFDLIFIDADKKNYLNYYKMTLPMLSTNGIIIVDNILWQGKVADEKTNDKETLIMREFNEYVSNDPSVEQIILPIRDGLMLIYRK